MLTDRIIGRVGADILRRRLDEARQGDLFGDESTALFRLDKLSPAQIAAVVREILANPDLARRVDLRIPMTLVEGEDLPIQALTSLNAGAVRNGGTTREALLTANGNEHNLADTLGHVSALGAKELRANEDAWVEASCHVAGMSPTPEDRAIFRAALKGLIAATELSLNDLAEYCCMISEATTSHGHPIRHALGWALHCVGLPRDTLLFANTKSYSSASTSWRKAFEKLYATRAPLLKRLRPNGQPLDADEMRERFEQNVDDIAESAQDTIKAFIEAVPGNSQTAVDLAVFEWEQDGVHHIFDKPRARQLGLAEATLHFFEHDCDEECLLEERWRTYLDEFKGRERRSEGSDEDDESFFDLHRRYMEQNPALHSRWEKFIFGKPIECNDFLDGLATVTHRLIARAGLSASGKERFLRLTVSKGRTELRERFNHDVGTFFSLMYRGLRDLMGDKVEWPAIRGATNLPDPIFEFPLFAAKEKEIRGKKFKKVVSLARQAIQIKFEVALIEGRGDSQTILEKTQLLWTFRSESIGLSLLDDMRRLQEKGTVACTEVPRRMVSKKGGVQSVSLLDTSTIEATFSRDAGSLVPASSKLKSLRNVIKTAINGLASESRLTSEQRDELRSAWDVFEADYSQAVKDFIETGLHGEAVLRQADSFATFLRALLTHARGDICRSKLVSETISIGTVRVLGDQPCVIIPPWHPERMKALAVKTRRVAGLISHMLGGTAVSFGDRNIFFREFSAELAHPFYPEIAIATSGGSAVLVSETSTVNGYSLLERPIRGEDSSMSDVDPSIAAKQVKELMERYVGLQPHEAANLSILLYNSDAAELPVSVVRELAGMQTNGGFQCDISVRHRDPEKLRRVYTELVAKASDDPDLPVVSETSENFISKLRMSAIPATSTPPSSSSAGFRPFDIAFLHDVISRTAVVEWISVDWSNDRPNLEHVPSRWSYRSVSGENELKSTTFLTCPRQTASGWAYVNTVASVARQLDAPLNTQYLPARRISLQSEALHEILDDAHSLAEWVATYDELLDKRQLQANGITVVRYRRATTNGRNMIVSSTSELRLLSVLLRRRLEEVVTLTPDQLNEVTNRAKRDALSISGDIVLRAAKRGVSAGEMIGLVMSRYLVERELKGLAGNGARPAFTAYFLLDDYADWLAQRESRIADILGLCVEESDDGPLLHVAVVESKYVSVHGAAEARRSSKAQLLATLSTFRDALFGDPGRLDRDLWLSRLADLLIDSDIPPGCAELLERMRAKLRDGEAKISLRGYSHIFIHSSDPTTQSPGSERLLLDNSDGIDAWQEVFDRPDLRRLLEAYSCKEDPTPIRESFGFQTPWTLSDPRLPAARVAWSAMVERLTPVVESYAEVRNEVTPVQLPPDTTVETSPLKTPKEFKPTVSDENPLAEFEHGHTEFARLVSLKAASLFAAEDERESWAEEATKKLKTALNSYGLQTSVLGTRLTPNGCLIRLAGSDRLRVEDIETKRTQLLTTHALRLVTVQPKPGEIVITLASEKRQSVSMWDLWAHRKLNRNAAGINTSFILGLQEISGSILYLNLGGEFGGLAAHEPHSLVAGATGSGKSVLIQAILLDIAATNPKELAQIVLIDPKMGVDYVALENLPHLREPMVTTRERAAEVLAGLVEEMETRYRTFAAARARDLATYNAKATPDSRLPMIFLVHDEFADWMLDDGYKAAVGAAVQRLGVKARAAGIHLIFAAQRPDKDVMPMQLRENLGNRLILKVASEATSKIALDRPGAELLLGKGHLAAKLNGEQGLIFAQAPFLSDEDIGAVVEAISQCSNDLCLKQK
ncbi:FtsK/SpoIIIE domain-containing protein [Methylomonas koyamae]|uniref:Cell division protein FtsK n=1 Tax=Methylomonas koyamae TaxID=702114 RepID=A0A177NHS9_9GAMM|nr:FtsK/SpoIIIE domain-containing protein [Methylomonas koyamae]OAI17527.1 cell division protein FtsK [Methylomonas koyamae]